MLESKGHVVRLNIIDNQASQTIKKFLTEKQCESMMVEPNNYSVNVAERVIQTFKDHIRSSTMSFITLILCQVVLKCMI